MNEELKLPFLEVYSLQQIATAKAIVEISKNDEVKKSIVDLFKVYDHFYDEKYDVEYWYDQTDSLFRSDGMINLIATMNHCIDQMAIPSIIGTILKKYTAIVSKEIANWVRYHDRHIFKATEFVSKASNFIQFVKWNWLGLIDYSATARILIEIDGLSEEEKFRLIAVNCFEDVAATLSPDTVNGYFDSIQIKENNQRYDMIYLYWTAFVTKNFTKLHNILRKRVLHIEVNDWNVYFLRWSRWAHPTSTEYFFNKLNTREKIDLCKELIPMFGMRSSFLWQFVLTCNLESQVITQDDCRFFLTILCDTYWKNYFTQLFNRYRDILTIEHLVLIVEAFEVAMWCVDMKFCLCRDYINMWTDFWLNLTDNEKRQMFGRRDTISTLIRHIHYAECRAQILEIFRYCDYSYLRSLLQSSEIDITWADLVYSDDCKPAIYEFLNQILVTDDAEVAWTQICRRI